MANTVIDLFAGIGGLSDGFHQSGCQILGAVEWEPELARLYEENHKRRGVDVDVLNEDVRNVSAKALLREFRLEPGELTYLVGGSPCQGYSTIGKRRKDDERNQLIFEFPRLLKTIRPRAFLIENVPGLIGFDGGSTLERLLGELISVGYSNTTYQLVDASACGVPQRRVRAIVFGTSGDALPNLAHLRKPAKNGPTCWDAIGDLPNPEKARALFEAGTEVPYGRNLPSTYARKLRGRRTKVSHWEPVIHTSKVERSFSTLRQGDTDPDTRCWRLPASGYARTLRAGSRSRTACRPVHPFQARVITVREAARIHSFPDFYRFPNSKSAAHAAIGNAVPPQMARRIADAFNNALGRSA